MIEMPHFPNGLGYIETRLRELTERGVETVAVELIESILVEARRVDVEGGSAALRWVWSVPQ